MKLLPNTPWLYAHGKDLHGNDYYIKARFYNRFGEDVDHVTKEQFESITITKEEFENPSRGPENTIDEHIDE